jgi:hypothetical protein
MFDAPDALLALEQVLKEVSTGRFPTNEGFLDVIRQAALVNLWFYTKFVAGDSGPYDLINDTLHVGMCNYRQTLLEPGCRGAMYLPRGHNKSSIVTECGSAWEMTRDPSIRIRITNAIAEKAQDFLKSVKSIFEENDYVKALWPQLVPTGDWDGWNNTILTFPKAVRGKKYREGNLEYGGVGGASEGHHYDLHIVDDMIGLNALNANRGGNAVMLQTENWFWASEKPLLSSMKTGRVIVVGTRYANDDVYASILKQAHSAEGYPMLGFEPNPEGKWRVYYRKAEEDGEVVYPEQYTKEGFEELRKTDYWTYVTQYLNEPSSSGLAELVAYEALPATLDYDNGSMEWTLFINQGEKELMYPFSACYLSQAGDPAATEKYVSAKTSRSANAVIATTPDDRVVVVDGNADFVAPSKFFDWLFQAKKRFKDALQVTWLESNAGFKVLAPFLREEEKKRKIHLNLRPFASSSDKDARIRSALQPLLERKGLYAVESVQKLLNGELVGFPQSRRKDFLDALATAVTKRVVPEGGDAKEAKKRSKERWMRRTSNRAGY